MNHINCIALHIGVCPVKAVFPPAEHAPSLRSTRHLSAEFVCVLGDKGSLKERLISWGDYNKMDGFLFTRVPSSESLCLCRVELRTEATNFIKHIFVSTMVPDCSDNL